MGSDFDSINQTNHLTLCKQNANKRFEPTRQPSGCLVAQADRVRCMKNKIKRKQCHNILVVPIVRGHG